MNNYLIDSNIVIDYFNKIPYATKLIENDLGNSQYISIVTITEVTAGWSKREVEKNLPILYGLFLIETITSETAAFAGSLRYEYARKGLPLATTDVIIAATAIYYDFILVTRNKKDFPMPELKFFTF